MLKADQQAIFYHTLASIPAGRYTTYGALAKLCQVHVRQILAWLKKLPDDTDLPWHRVINSQHKISSHPNCHLQYELLKDEGLIPDQRSKYAKDWLWPSH
ncbi:MGMT family protein [Reinekea marinisedimentorum]|uniref:Methylated-DNA-protein-cysteine methyltransferase-like protein n=1 Tax=Reinekea marinisedimentorum TaxID=230495 RepID=A0A4R3IB66_9GAMM|nr:MGMT family protein [Reinekea marinisedimentorum]TCS43849.1 methylated-DNA-protein-cysteine methyltransferase-like protein [Reinekea marinisedimentorum]